MTIIDVFTLIGIISTLRFIWDGMGDPKEGANV